MIDFSYEPMSEEDAQKARYKLLDDGIYKGVIEHAESKISSSHNPMGEFLLRIWDKDGLPKEIRDYIPVIPSMIWKLRHLCQSTGLIKEFDEKKFKPEMTIGKDVMVKIKTQQGKEIPFDKLNGKPEGSKYPDKNVAEDYLELLKNNGMKPLPVKDDDFDDKDIPF